MGGCVCMCVHKGCLPLPLTTAARLYFANKELAKNSPGQSEADRPWWGWAETCVGAQLSYPQSPHTEGSIPGAAQVPRPRWARSPNTNTTL